MTAAVYEEEEEVYTVRARELVRWFFANNSVIIVSATMKLDQNLVRLTP